MLGRTVNKTGMAHDFVQTGEKKWIWMDTESVIVLWFF